MPIRNLIVLLFFGAASTACYFKSQHNRYAATLAHAMTIIQENYVDEIDARKLFEGAMDGMVGKLDKYSAYVNPNNYRKFKESLDQQFGGIGIVVQGPPTRERLTVMSPLPNSPAHRAGLRAGDVIMEIDGVSTEGMQLADAVTYMRGKPGDPVHLVIKQKKSGESKPFDIKRANIPIESVKGDRRNDDGSWIFQREDNPRIGLARVLSFGERTVVELQTAMQESEGKIDAMIIDLRDNVGGLLTAAVGVCDLFISDGVIVTTRGRKEKMMTGRRFAATPNTSLSSNVEVVVLINGQSASASEIVAACLQDHNRAKIIGSRSWGKGSVQNIIPLETKRSALKLTTATYWRPSGKNIHRRDKDKEEDDWGVRPDKGFAIPIDKEAWTNISKQRQHRDVFRDADDLPAPKNEIIGDPQMKKAIEYLKARLQAKAAESQQA